jgi:hypothetical protein
MGGASQIRQGSLKKAKSNKYGGSSQKRKKDESSEQQQERTCTRCEQRGSSYKHGHSPWCHHLAVFKKNQEEEAAAAAAAAPAKATASTASCTTSTSNPVSISKKVKTITSQTPCILKINATVDTILHKQQWSACTIMKTP